MKTPTLHIINLLIRTKCDGAVRFLVYPRHEWAGPHGRPYLILPAKRTVPNPLEPFLRGTPLDDFVDAIMREDLGTSDPCYAIEAELEPVDVVMPSPNTHTKKDYVVYPILLWVDPAKREELAVASGGCWLTCREGISHPDISPSAKRVFAQIRKREAELDRRYKADPDAEHKPGAPLRLLNDVPDRPSMDALAMRWLEHNRTGVRHLSCAALNEILDAGNRAFNLRVADPYLRYQMQGQGFTWSFFTHKDKQDIHVHGAPVVEIYGVLEGELEIWWKPYYERGTSAWSHRILGTGDWVEVDSLNCHIVHWRTEGKGVVFKAGPGPLAEVGKLGVKGKTPCDACPCMKPPEVLKLLKLFASR